MVMVSINGTEHPYRYGLGSMMIIETLPASMRPSAERPLISSMVTHYACLLNGDNDLDLTYNDLVDACEEDPQLALQLSEAFMVEKKRFDERNIVTEDGHGEAKKNSQS